VKSMKLLLLIIVIIGGCTTIDSRRPWRSGIVDEQTGDIVAFWLQCGDENKAITVEKEYGMIVVWSEKEKHFYLFDNSGKRYFGTTDFEAFIAEIEMLPNDITFQKINTCCAPLDYKMPDEASEKLFSILRKGNRSLDPHTACTCESTDRKFLNDTTGSAAE